MVKTITDVITTIFFITLAAFLVRNAAGTAKVAQSFGSVLTGTLKAATFQ